MKIKKLLSALLATAMVFALLCVPASAAGTADTLAEINDDGNIWIGVTDPDALKTKITVRAREWEANDNNVLTRGNADDPVEWDVYKLPLGVTLAAGPNNDSLRNVWVYSDPDGDGIFDERIEKVNWDEDDTAISSEIIPVSSTGPFTITENERYYNVFNWGYGSNVLAASLKNLPGYHTLTTDYLVEQFGANTLILFLDDTKEYYIGFLVTGEKAPEGVVRSLADEGVYFSEFGDVVSGWAVEPVNKAIEAGVYDQSVADSHNYNLTGNITRGEFAIIAVNLYEAMSGETARYTDTDPFVDVDAEADVYMYESIMCARDLGIVKGTSTVNKTFEPNAPVSRQDAALMLSRVYEALGGTIPAATATTFADNNQIAGYAVNAVAFMTSKQIINGVGSNRFNPKGNASVEQALKIALEMLDKLDV